MSRLSLFGSLVLVALVAGACGDEDEEELASPGAHVSCLSCCGNGVKADDEECDDGNLYPQDGCTSFCTLARCGDGIVRRDPVDQDQFEECDDGNDIDDDSCSNDCKAASCGNAKREDLEECDDGNNVGGDGCSAGCRREPHGDYRGR